MIITVQIISIGVASTIAVILLVTVTTLMMAILLFKHTNKHYELNQQNEPVYEEINTLEEGHGPINSTNPAAIKMEINCSYGDIQTIKMTESLAYGQIENLSQPAH